MTLAPGHGAPWRNKINAIAKTAEYKGRKYHVAWVGETKFGRRAKLQFLDRSKEFWADAADVRFAPTTALLAPPRHNGAGPRAWSHDYGRSTMGLAAACTGWIALARAAGTKDA